jgi:YD repeat-containing protein
VKSRNRWFEALAAGALIAAAAAAYATETITYKYDARGRLIEVNRSGSVNNNVVTNYGYDKADNRNQVTTTGSPNPRRPDRRRTST